MLLPGAVVYLCDCTGPNVCNVASDLARQLSCEMEMFCAIADCATAVGLMKKPRPGTYVFFASSKPHTAPELFISISWLGFVVYVCVRLGQAGPR